MRCPICAELHATDMVAHIIARHPDEAPRILAIEAQARGEALDVEKVRTALHATCQPSQCTLPSGYEEAVVRAILAGETE